MTITNVSIRSEVTVNESLALGPGSTANVSDNGANSTANLTPTTATPVSAKSHFSQALTSGTASIDLTALVDDQGHTLSTSGLRVQVVKVQNPNANQLSVAPAGSNGYGLTFIVPPQGEILLTSANLLGVIGSGAHLLTLTGTGTQSSNWLIVCG